MTPLTTAIYGLATIALATLASDAFGQRFVWPPAAGDRVAGSPVGGRETDDLAATAPESVPETRPIDGYPGGSAGPQVAGGAFAVADSPRPGPGAAPHFSPGPADSTATRWRILENPNGRHTALFFDPVRQVFAVYHIDAASGEIMLKSVRNLGADLRLPHFNSSNPAPKEIQAMLDEAR